MVIKYEFSLFFFYFLLLCNFKQRKYKSDLQLMFTFFQKQLKLIFYHEN